MEARGSHETVRTRGEKCRARSGEITIYALRHSNIVRQLLSRVPTRVVAVNHDTSVAMIEKNYSRYISDHSDAITRAALLDTQPGRATERGPPRAGFMADIM